MIELPSVTLVCIDCYKVGQSISAIKKTLSQITPNKTLFFCDINVSIDNVETVIIPSILSKNEYSRFVIKDLYKFIETDFVLIIQHDGYVLDGKQWNDSLLNYDYIGSRWMYPENERAVGNGGFSLRSLKLMTALGLDNFIIVTEQEDDAICRLYGSYLEQEYDIKFAPIEVADNFSFELRQPVNKTFGFHGYFHPPFKEHIVLKREAAMGDVIMLEPIMEYYNRNGYQVVLDTLPQFMGLFKNHYFSILHISELSHKIKPVKIINFDMSYEVKPNQLVLESYIELTGESIPLIRPKLNCSVNESAKFFENYILIHIDETGMPHRQAHGISWKFVVNYYQRLGYTVLQIGKRVKEQIATYFNTVNLETLAFMIKNASLVIGLDSGITQISSALNTPSIIFFGSVNPSYRYCNFDNIEVLHSSCITKDDDFCYHSKESTTTGVKCKYNESLPPCTVFNEWQIIESANKLLSKI